VKNKPICSLVLTYFWRNIIP